MFVILYAFLCLSQAHSGTFPGSSHDMAGKYGDFEVLQTSFWPLDSNRAKIGKPKKNKKKKTENP